MTPQQKAEKKQRANLTAGRSTGLVRKRTNTSYLPAVLKELLEGATPNEIMEQSGISNQALKRLITSLRLPESSRIVYISGWELVGRTWQPVYKLGYGYDRNKPKPLTQAEKSKRFRERQKLKLLNQSFHSLVTGESIGMVQTSDT